MEEFLAPVTVLTLIIVGAVFLAFARRAYRAKVESEKRSRQARRRKFIPVTQERRSGLPRRDRDRLQEAMGGIVAHEVDPLVEAQAYLSRGRDRDAEYVLKDAIARDPTRHELKLRLLTIYRERQDPAAFDPLAEELCEALRGRGGELWDQLEAMGRCLNPHNRAPRAWRDGSNAGAHVPDEALWETTFETRDRQRRHAHASKLALAKICLDIDDTRGALSLLNEALAREGWGSTVSAGPAQNEEAAADSLRRVIAPQEDLFSAVDYKGLERRKSSRRTMPNSRSAIAWHPKAIDRRQGLGRRREDCL